MSKKRAPNKPSFTYPTYALKPSDLLHFVYLDGFVNECECEGLGEVDIEAIEVAIMAGGKDSPVIRGTSGLRKMRFAPANWNCGKSGAARVCFVYFQEFSIVLFVMFYRKSELDDLSESAKKEIKQIIEETHRYLVAKNAIQ